MGPSGGGGGRDPPAALADADLSSGSASHPEADHTTDSFSPAKKEQKLILQERLEVIIGLSEHKTIKKWGNIDVQDISSSKLLISF